MDNTYHCFTSDPFNEKPSVAFIVDFAITVRHPHENEGNCFLPTEILTLMSPCLSEGLQRALACMMTSLLAKESEVLELSRLAYQWQNIKLAITQESDNAESNMIRDTAIKSFTDSIADNAFTQYKKPFSDIRAAIALVDEALLSAAQNTSGGSCKLHTSTLFETILSYHEFSAGTNDYGYARYSFCGSFLWHIANLYRNMTALQENVTQTLAGEHRAHYAEQRIHEAIEGVDSSLVHLHHLFYFSRYTKFSNLTEIDIKKSNAPSGNIGGYLLDSSFLSLENFGNNNDTLLHLLDKFQSSTSSIDYVKLTFWGLIITCTFRVLETEKHRIEKMYRDNTLCFQGYKLDDEEYIDFIEKSFSLSPTGKSILDIDSTISHSKISNYKFKAPFANWLEGRFNVDIIKGQYVPT